MVLQVLPQRGVGVVSGGSQVIGELMKEMIAAWFDGDNGKASQLYFRLAPFFAALNQNGRINPIPILRAAIEIASGIPIGPPRSPQLAAAAQERAVITGILEKLNLGTELQRSAAR
jgi:4-hydroxy-tetrahydrodipicolinate synthase